MGSEDAVGEHNHTNTSSSPRAVLKLEWFLYKQVSVTLSVEMFNYSPVNNNNVKSKQTTEQSHTKTVCTWQAISQFWLRQSPCIGSDQGIKWLSKNKCLVHHGVTPAF